VVVEPPGNLGRARILKVHDCIFIAVKIVLVKKGSRPMQQSREDKFDVIADALPVKTGKHRRRGSTVKTPIVIKDPDSQA
jgi:hypothetical protein